MLSKLEQTIAEAEVIYLRHIDQLENIRLLAHVAYSGRRGTKEVTEGSVKQWMAAIIHNPHGRHTKLNRHATAYYKKQHIIYNPKYLAAIEQRGDWHTRILDLVLHEMGHLFTYHFYGLMGHDWSWCETGKIVGYAPVGSSREENRMRYASYAAHAGTVEAVEKPMGRIAKTIGDAPRASSSVQSPVALVWAICRRYPFLSRREVVRLCVSQGINVHTARTQYQRWYQSEKKGY